MLNKKIYICIFCLFFILSIQTISATDNTTNNELSNTYNIQKNNLETNVQYDDVSTENKDTKLSLDEQDKSTTDKTRNEDPLTFADLNDTINGNSNSTINLSNNYKYNGDSDSALIEGISISRNLTIYGNGVTIDGNGVARIFNVNDSNLTVNFYNIKFINTYAEFGGALVGGDSYNCIFTNNKANYAGGAIYLGKAFDCTFIGNSAFTGGAMYQGLAVNSTFINNTADEFAGAIFEGIAINCTFTDNNALAGQAMCDGTAILCRFYNNTYELTSIIPASINVLNYTSQYKSGKKLKFNLTVDNMLFDGFNTTINIYKDGSLVKTIYALTGEGWVVDLEPGEYTAVLNLTDYPDENPSNATLNVTKGNTIVNITPITNVNIGEEVTINYTTNSNGTVTIKVNGQSITDKKFTPTKEGTYNITVEIAENDYYTAGYNETSFIAEKTNTTIEIKPIPNVVVGEEVTINYTTNSNGTATIKINGETIKEGKFTPTKAGTYNLTVEIAENEYYKAATNQTTFTVNKATSKIIANPVNTTYNIVKYLIVTLKDENGNPIIFAPLTVKNLNSSKILITNTKGQVKINIATLPPKTYRAMIIYLESDNYKGSTNIVPVTVKKATPKITAKSTSYKLKTKTKKYAVIIKDNKNKALKNEKVSLKVNGKTYNTKTNSKGQGIFKITNFKKKGTYKAVITVPANKYYNKVTKTVKISVKA